jgi:hypothetical protein
MISNYSSKVPILVLLLLFLSKEGDKGRRNEE